MQKHGRILAIASVCLAISCGARDSRLNVILIGIDTVRQDHLSCYGYSRNTTPNIDSLARRGILFENAVSPSPWTLPSFATVFTSLYPTQHGAVTPVTSMRTSFPTLAALLRDRGYATGAIINAPYLDPRYKLSRGFELYDMPPHRGRVADGTTADALNWIDLNKDHDFFIFVHYFDPHTAYSPPAPYDTIFDPDYSGPIGSSYKPERVPGARASGFVDMDVLTQADRNHIMSLYDGEIAFTDKAIGDLLQGLDERGLRGRSLIVLLSDHGEEFFDHNGFEHGHTLFDELIKVPLIISLPGMLPEDVRIPHQVRLVDVAPTILDLLELDQERGFEGVSLKPLIDGNTGLAPGEEALLGPGIAYSEALLYGYEKKSVTAYPWKLICDMSNGEKSFFNLEEDAGEHESTTDVPYESRRELEGVLFRTVFEMSDTWHVELAGGDREHTFSLEISFGSGHTPAHLKLHKVFDSAGHVHDTRELTNIVLGPSGLRIKNLRVKDPVRFAFMLTNVEAPVRFNLKIDGERVPDRTFLGESLTRPPRMPFTEEAPKDDVSINGEPATRPAPPYFVIWHDRADYRSDTRIELDEETRRELRSLGYIQ